MRKLAAAKMAQEKPGQTLQATALVHEAYMLLVGPENNDGWDNRGHFFAAAAEAMRRILIENARRKQTQRHGGALQRLDLLEGDILVGSPDRHVLLLDDALAKLAGPRPRAAELVKLRFFAGLTVDQAAPIVGVSPRTARRLWVYARAWLRREMESKTECNS